MAPVRRLLAALAAVFLLAAPTAALAQTNLPPLSVNPPATKQHDSAPKAQSDDHGSLPNTGTDARIVALAGAALVVAGIGLRLRARDARF